MGLFERIFDNKFNRNRILKVVDVRPTLLNLYILMDVKSLADYLLHA